MDTGFPCVDAPSRAASTRPMAHGSSARDADAAARRSAIVPLAHRRALLMLAALVAVASLNYIFFMPLPSGREGDGNNGNDGGNGAVGGVVMVHAVDADRVVVDHPVPLQSNLLQGLPMAEQEVSAMPADAGEYSRTYDDAGVEQVHEYDAYAVAGRHVIGGGMGVSVLESSALPHSHKGGNDDAFAALYTDSHGDGICMHRMCVVVETLKSVDDAMDTIDSILHGSATGGGGEGVLVVIMEMMEVSRRKSRFKNMVMRKPHSERGQYSEDAAFDEWTLDASYISSGACYGSTDGGSGGDRDGGSGGAETSCAVYNGLDRRQLMAVVSAQHGIEDFVFVRDDFVVADSTVGDWINGGGGGGGGGGGSGLLAIVDNLGAQLRRSADASFVALPYAIHGTSVSPVRVFAGVVGTGDTDDGDAAMHSVYMCSDMELVDWHARVRLYTAVEWPVSSIIESPPKCSMPTVPFYTNVGGLRAHSMDMWSEKHTSDIFEAMEYVLAHEHAVGVHPRGVLYVGETVPFEKTMEHIAEPPLELEPAASLDIGADAGAGEQPARRSRRHNKRRHGTGRHSGGGGGGWPDEHPYRSLMRGFGNRFPVKWFDVEQRDVSAAGAGDGNGDSVAAVHVAASKSWFVGCTRDTPRCDVDYLRDDVGLLTPPCCVEHIKELVLYVCALLSEKGITHWISDGTALGVIRGQGIIPWDFDADLSVLGSDWKKVRGLAGRIQRDGYHIRMSEDPEVMRVFLSPTNGMYIDVYPWTRHGRKLTNNVGMPPMALAYVKPTVTRDFYGATVHVPNNPETWIAEQYGPSWRTPQRTRTDNFAKWFKREFPCGGRSNNPC